MADGQVQVLPDSTGKIIDTSELTRESGTVVERQRIVLADPDDPTDTYSLDSVRQDRQFQEITMIEAIEVSVNGNIFRSRERQFATDRRGASLGRGAVR